VTSTNTLLEKYATPRLMLFFRVASLECLT
jgi:hypothetical protein